VAQDGLVLGVEFKGVGNAFRVSEQFKVVGTVWQRDGQGLAAYFREKGVDFFERYLEVQWKGEGISINQQFHFFELRVKN
jgi:hypothetical protein